MKLNKEKLAKIAWNMIDGEFGILPPDNNEVVEVMDAGSNKARAIPCYHNFNINDYPITCFTFNPFWKMYGIFFAIESYLQFSLTYDFTDYGEKRDD